MSDQTVVERKDPGVVDSAAEVVRTAGNGHIDQNDGRFAGTIGDIENAGISRGVDSDPLHPERRSVYQNRHGDLELSLRQIDDAPRQTVGEGDLSRTAEFRHAGIGAEHGLAKRNIPVVGVHHVVERGHHVGQGVGRTFGGNIAEDIK